MKVLLGLDVGDVRVGTALSDQAGLLAHPHGTFDRAKGIAETHILGLLQEHGISQVVVGLPLDERGARTPQCDKVEQFVRRLARRCSAEFHFVDEYASSEEAAERLSASYSSRRRKDAKDKGMIDAASAAIILQVFLDAQKKSLLE